MSPSLPNSGASSHGPLAPPSAAIRPGSDGPEGVGAYRLQFRGIEKSRSHLGPNHPIKKTVNPRPTPGDKDESVGGELLELG